MVLLSARGFALEDAGAGLVIDLDDRKHPLVAAAGRREPAPLEGPFRDPRLTALLGRAPLYGLPLYGRNGRAEWTSGLLVVGPWTEETEPAATWLSRVLGHRLLTDSRPSPGAEPDKKGRRERLLLDSVPDPILLTEPEGGMLVANARAQSLLATADGDSEGRRRAVAFNNMLLSAALAQSMLQGEGRPREVLLVDPADGSDLLYELLSTAVSDPREGTAVVSILRNVTDLRRAMEEVADNYPPPAPGGSGRARRARPAGPHHRLRGGPHPGDGLSWRARAHEHAGRAALQRPARLPARLRAARPRERRALLVVRLERVPLAGPAARGRHRPRRPPRPARRCLWRRSPARSSRSTARWSRS
jgi:PAS domain-containing protein